MNKEYKIKLDLNKKLYNKKMTFNQFDENVNDFYIEVTKNNEVVKDLDKSIVTLVAIKPNNTVDAQFIEAKEGQIYADLKPSMCDVVGNYQAKAMIVLEGEIVTTDTINYSVSEDKIISRLNNDVVSDERFAALNDMLSRLSELELNEANRKDNFNAIQDEFEAIKNDFNELITTKTEAKVNEITGTIVDDSVKKHTEKVVNDLADRVIEVDAKVSEVNSFIAEKDNIISNTISNANNKVDEAIAKIPPKSELIGPQGPQGPQGAKGDKGEQGIQGIQGLKGNDGLTTSVTINGTKYTHSNGNITLPAYPTLSSLGAEPKNSNKQAHIASIHAPINAQKNSDITKAEIENKLTGNITTHTHNQYLTQHQDLSSYATKSELPTKTSQLTNDSGYLTSIPSEYITEAELDIDYDVLLAFNTSEIIGNDYIGYINANKNIILNQSLEEGTYTLKYINKDGSSTKVAGFTVSEEGIIWN